MPRIGQQLGRSTDLRQKRQLQRQHNTVGFIDQTAN